MRIKIIANNPRPGQDTDIANITPLIGQVFDATKDFIERENGGKEWTGCVSIEAPQPFGKIMLNETEYDIL